MGRSPLHLAKQSRSLWLAEAGLDQWIHKTVAEGAGPQRCLKLGQELCSLRGVEVGQAQAGLVATRRQRALQLVVTHPDPVVLGKVEMAAVAAARG